MSRAHVILLGLITWIIRRHLHKYLHTQHTHTHSARTHTDSTHTYINTHTAQHTHTHTHTHTACAHTQTAHIHTLIHTQHKTHTHTHTQHTKNPCSQISHLPYKVRISLQMNESINDRYTVTPLRGGISFHNAFPISQKTQSTSITKLSAA